MTTPTTTVIIVADGCGVGAGADAHKWHTSKANTLGHVLEQCGTDIIPTLKRWGMASLVDLTQPGMSVARDAYVAKAVMHSKECDTPAGHWELFGRVTTDVPGTFPEGFPEFLLELLCETWQVGGILGNRAMGGLEAINQYGVQQLNCGWPIVYTSSDSVLQIAAHDQAVALDRLYQWCDEAREICDQQTDRKKLPRVGRIIARPFTGPPAVGYTRLGGLRRDWGVKPPTDGALERLEENGVPIVAIGKIGDIFSHENITRELHPEGLNNLCDATLDTAHTLQSTTGGVVIVNLVDFDYRGHARDVQGFADALQTLDQLCLNLETIAGDNTRIVVTADHGCDPTHTVDDRGEPHLNHTRENVPLVVKKPGAGWTGTPQTRNMADLGASVCAWHDTDSQNLDGTVILETLN